VLFDLVFVFAGHLAQDVGGEMEEIKVAYIHSKNKFVCCSTPLQHTTATHHDNTPLQQTIATHHCNTPPQHTTPQQLTTATHHCNNLLQHILVCTSLGRY